MTGKSASNSPGKKSELGKKSNTGMTPIDSDSGDDRASETESSATDYEAKTNYKTAAYWNMPENVRHAIDKARSKSKHSDFYAHLKTLTEKIGVYKKLFYTKRPMYERSYMDKQRMKIGDMVKKEH